MTLKSKFEHVKLTENLTRKIKTSPFLTTLGSKNHFLECLEGWKVPGVVWHVPGKAKQVKESEKTDENWSETKI